MCSARIPDEKPSMEALLYQALKEGVLPITSTCNMGCVFCSNRYNPRSCEVFTIGTRSLDDIEETIPWLQNAPGAVVIGESVTRINEGEPLTHPDFLEIIEKVRAAYPDKPIRVTTNGSLLTPAMSRRLGALGVELIVSLNTVGKRPEIMGDPEPEVTLKNVRALSGILKFEGSIVALPFLAGWDDIRETCRFLRDSGAVSIRLLAPGFSAKHPLASKMPPSTWPESRRFARLLSEEMGLPVLFEPPELKDLCARVEAVMDNTPARVAGLLPGDIITRVSGVQVFTRKDAFELAKERGNPKITVMRESAQVEMALKKPRRTSPGFIVYEDLDSRGFSQWSFRAGFGRGTPPLILTSSLAKPLISASLEQRGLEGRVVSVKSRYFGGNIKAGGLLTVRDFLAAYRNATRGRSAPVTVTLPRRAFDVWGRDLEGVSHKRFSEKTGCPVILAG